MASSKKKSFEASMRSIGNIRWHRFRRFHNRIVKRRRQKRQARASKQRNRQ